MESPLSVQKITQSVNATVNATPVAKNGGRWPESMTNVDSVPHMRTAVKPMSVARAVEVGIARVIASIPAFRKSFGLAAIIFCFSGITAEAASTPTESLITIEKAFKQGKRDAWLNGLTERSRPLATRLERYRLERAIPANWQALDEKHEGKKAKVTVGIPHTAPGKSGWQKQQITFHKESNVWKLDLPDTLEQSLGPNWEKNIATAEQFYLMMEQSMGPEQSDKFLVQVLTGMKKKDASKGGVSKPAN